MGESVTEMLQFLCRLCARTDKSCVNVFSSDGDKFSIQKKIRLCLPVIVEEQDEMPRQICLSCLNKLESTYEFYTTCIYAQSTIKRLLKAKSLQDSDNVNKPSSEMKENIPTTFSLDQYLKRKIDPTDAGKSSKVQKTDRPVQDLTNNNVHVETTKVSDSEVNTASGNSNGSTVNTDKSEFQSARTSCESNNTSLVATNNSSATPAETHKPKLRVRTTSELREAGRTSTVTDCVSALLSLQNSTAQSASVPTTRQSTSVSASHLTSVVFSQSATPQSSHTTSSFPQQVKNAARLNVKNSSALNGGTSWSPVVQSAKGRSPMVQLGKNSSAPQSIRSSPSILRFSTSSSSALQTATNSLSASQNGTTLLPTPKNATISLPVPKNAAVSLPVQNNSTVPVTVANNATVSLSLPQNVTNSPSLHQYSLSVPTSGCPILPKVSQFIIVPNTFATTPTFTAAGTNTVTVLARALPSNMSLVGDLSVPLGTATTLVAPQSTQPPQSGSVQPLTISTSAAVPLASSSLPLVQTVPLQVTQQLPNPVMTPLTSAPAVINQTSTSSSVAFSVLNRNNKDIVVTSNARVTVTTSTPSVSSKSNSQHSKLSQTLKASSGSPVGSTSNAPTARVSTEGKIVGSRSDIVVQSAGTTALTVSSKQNSSAQSKANVTVSRAASHAIILPKPAAPVVTGAKKSQSNSSSILQSHLIYTVPNNKNSLIKPTKTPQGSSSWDSDIPTTVLCYSNQLATKANCFHSDKRTKAPTQVSIPQTTVVTSVSAGNPSFSISVGPAQQLKEGARSVVIQKKNTDGVENTQPPTTSLVSSVKKESQFSENGTHQKAVTPRSQPSGGLPPPPLAVPLNSVSENRRKLASSECADLQKREATSKSSGHQVSRDNSQRQSMKDLEVPQKSCTSNQAKSELTPKPRGPVATATVTPFNTTSQPASDPEGQSPRSPSPDLEVEPLSPSSDSTTARKPGRSSNSSPAAAEQKEECPYCHVEFPADILIHHKTLHYREKFYTCIDCDKNFVTEKGLESHRCQKESKG